MIYLRNRSRRSLTLNLDAPEARRNNGGVLGALFLAARGAPDARSGPLPDGTERSTEVLERCARGELAVERAEPSPPDESGQSGPSNPTLVRRRRRMEEMSTDG